MRAGNPKTFWEKVKNIFKDEECVDFYYDKYNIPGCPIEELVIDMGKSSKKNVWRSLRGVRIRAIKNRYRPSSETEQPSKTLEGRILNKFESIKDFDEIISSRFDIIDV